MPFNNVIQYTDAFLNSIDSSDLERLVENCFTSKTKNYELLAKLTAKLGTYQLCPLHHAIRILEEKAVEVMLSNYRNSSIEEIKSPHYSLSLIWNQIEEPIQYNMSMSTKKEKILYIADQFLSLKENVTKSDLENYAKVASLPKLFKLMLDKKVNLEQMNLNFPQYEVEYHKPMLIGSKYNSIEDVLLTHTYSYSKNISEVRQIYSNLLHNSKMASDVMHYTAINIIEGDNLKIFFGPKFEGFEGGYIPFLNYVIINPTSGKFSSESIAIHELSHYALCNINPNTGCAPFDISKLNYFSSTQDDLYGHHINNQVSIDTKEVKFFQDFKTDATIFLQYEQAAKLVIIKAGKLLGISEDKFDPYVFSKDFILCLKDNSLIDLFLNAQNFTLSQKKVFAQAYHQYLEEFYPGQCVNKQVNFESLINSETCPVELSYEYISSLRFDDQDNFYNQVSFVKDYYFSYYKNSINLTENQNWFLERIADLVNREKDIYDIRPSYYNENSPSYYQYYIELIVRYPELKSSGMDQDILDSFVGLEQFFDDNISPKIQGMISEYFYQQKQLDFSYQEAY